MRIRLKKNIKPSPNLRGRILFDRRKQKNKRMKKQVIILILVVIILHDYTSYAQNIAIASNETTPNPSAMLDIVATDKGLLIPRVALTAINSASPITSPATSLVVYNSSTAGTAPNSVTPGFYYWDGTKWVRFQDGAGGNDWHVIGNAVIVATTNFLGTTDNVPLNFRVNNTKAGRIGNTADGSTFWGYQAGLSDDLSNNKNSFIGYQSGSANTTGENNTAMGYQSLNKNTTGASNTALGHSALFNNSTASFNTACGYRALYSDNTGSNNTAIGSRALCYNTTGYSNTAYGRGALFSNTSGYLNCAFGTAADTTSYGYESALFANTTGSRNIAFGNIALGKNTTGNQNIAMGNSALYENTSGSNNIAIGPGTLSLNSNAIDNIAVGGWALNTNTTQNIDNVVLGQSAMQYVSGSKNTVAGFQVLYGASSDAICDNNCAFGMGTLSSVTTGVNYNVAFGGSSLYGLQTGLNNTAIGRNTISSLQNGDNNTSLGVSNCAYASNFSMNTVAGVSALYTNTTGSGNVAIGFNSGYYAGIDASGNVLSILNLTPSNSVYLGNESDPAGTGQTNQIVIGSDSYSPNDDWTTTYSCGLGSNSLILGDANTSKTILRGKVGVGTTAPTAQLHIKGTTGYNQLRLRSDYTPTGTSDPNGQIGDIAKSATYIYVKTGAGWKRTAIATW